MWSYETTRNDHNSWGYYRIWESYCRKRSIQLLRAQDAFTYIERAGLYIIAQVNYIWYNLDTYRLAVEAIVVPVLLIFMLAE